MKMNYLPKSRVRNQYSKKAIGLAAIFVIGIFFFSLLDTWIISAISPLWRAENSVSRTLGKTVDFFHTHNSLVEENNLLEEKVRSLELELSTLSLAMSQYDALLNLMGRTAEKSGIVVAILTHPPQSPYDLIVIDAGSNDSISLGAKAKLLEGPEMGIVSEVYPSFSKVKLFSTPGERTNAVLERHQVPVVLLGTGAGNFSISLPRDTQVEIGDRILSSSLGQSLIAVVEDIKIEPTDSFKEVLARSPANIFELRFISILP